jgi:hypothetical protein
MANTVITITVTTMRVENSLILTDQIIPCTSRTPNIIAITWVANVAACSKSRRIGFFRRFTCSNTTLVSKRKAGFGMHIEMHTHIFHPYPYNYISSEVFLCSKR